LASFSEMVTPINGFRSAALITVATLEDPMLEFGV
jgi:hypothetical protein